MNGQPHLTEFVDLLIALLSQPAHRPDQAIHHVFGKFKLGQKLPKQWVTLGLSKLMGIGFVYR